MAIAWITEIRNLSDTDYAMWCDVPPGPSAFLGIFNGNDYGNRRVPIKVRSAYEVEQCAVPRSTGRCFRYLGGPRGVVRMYCSDVDGAERLVFENNVTGAKIGDLPIGETRSSETECVWFAITIDGSGIGWEVRYTNALIFSMGFSYAAEKLAPALIKVLG